jgi:hypothetical protein
VSVRLARADDHAAMCARSAAWLELGVYEFNCDAVAFYDALGFRTISRKMHTPLKAEP